MKKTLNNFSRRIPYLFIAVLLALGLLSGCGMDLTIHYVTGAAKPADQHTQEAEADAEEELTAAEKLMFLSAISQFAAKEDDNAERKNRDYYNLLIIGVDRRDDSWNGNSDTMLLCSVNYRTEEVHLISFMRDTEVTVPGYGRRKLNSAYALEGADLLVQTLYDNFYVEVDNYVWTDFEGLQAIMDIIGGVDVTITPEEAQYLKISGVTEDTEVHLNPKQALSYSRDRSSGGWDFGRTKRQRNVVMAVLDTVQDKSQKELIRMGIKMLPYIHHDFSAEDLFDILEQADEIRGYEFTEARVPFDDLYYMNDQNLVPAYDETRVILKDMIEGGPEEAEEAADN